VGADRRGQCHGVEFRHGIGEQDKNKGVLASDGCQLGDRRFGVLVRKSAKLYVVDAGCADAHDGFAEPF